MSNDLDDSDNEKLDMLANAVLEELVEDVSLGLCHQTHRAAKLGYLLLEETAIEEEKKYRIVDKKGFDVFGESSNQAKKLYECTCPHCERTLAAQRFAPHLEKCMGMGRNSSRIASKRITASTNSSKSSTATSGIGGDSDLEDNDKSSDNDWNEKTVGVKKSRKKKNNLSNGVSVKRLAASKKASSASHHSTHHSSSGGPSSTVTSINGLRSGDSSNLIETKSEYQF